MSTPIPNPLRAAAGLAAVAIDEARRLPDRLVSLPLLAVSTALQTSLKMQQRYAELVARGDQLLGQLRGQQGGAPPWARFDDDVPPAARPRSAFDAADEIPPDIGTDLADDVVDAGAVVDFVEVEIGDGLVVADLVDSEIDLATGPVDPADSADPAAGLLAEEEIGALADDAADYDGYLATEPPLAGYDTMSIPQLRARLRTLSEQQLEELIGYERATAERAPYLTMLENRLVTVRSR